MALILMIVLTFPLGYLVLLRTTALLTYLALHSLVFTFQSVGLLLNWVDGDTTAFGGPFPDHDPASFLSYGMVNTVIVVLGLGLVLLGYRSAARRRSRLANRLTGTVTSAGPGPGRATRRLQPRDQ